MIGVALIHRARVLSVAQDGARDAEGSRQGDGDPVAGAWIEARLMEYRGPAPGQRRGPETSAARVERRYEVLLDAVDETGAAVAVKAGSVLEFEAGPLGSPTVVLSGQPEVLTDGEDLYGFYGFAGVVKDAT